MGGQAQNKLQQTLIDFKAIPQANKTDGNQDRFELFARDFVKALGYEVEEQPGRGQDGGKDLLIRESLRGILQTIPRRWLLSAKHFAHSGRAVGTKDEINIRDRVDTFDADGFLGFYSTLPSSGLINAFKGLKKHIQVNHFDSALIGQYLLTDRRLDSVFKAYFPKSYSQFLEMGGYQAATTSEVQWEFAWQAESSTPFHFGETITPDVANYEAHTPMPMAPRESIESRPRRWGCFRPMPGV
jgi:hypothetical protein